MRRGKLWAWVIFALGALYFLLPLIATVQFSLSIRRDAITLDAYTNVIQSPVFQQTFGYSIVIAVAAIVAMPTTIE